MFCLTHVIATKIVSLPTTSAITTAGFELLQMLNESDIIEEFIYSFAPYQVDNRTVTKELILKPDWEGFSVQIDNPSNKKYWTEL